jgi:hypothetical protein
MCQTTDTANAVCTIQQTADPDCLADCLSRHVLCAGLPCLAACMSAALTCMTVLRVVALSQSELSSRHRIMYSC